MTDDSRLANAPKKQHDGANASREAIPQTAAAAEYTAIRWEPGQWHGGGIMGNVILHGEIAEFLRTHSDGRTQLRAWLACQPRDQDELNATSLHSVVFMNDIAALTLNGKEIMPERKGIFSRLGVESIEALPGESPHQTHLRRLAALQPYAEAASEWALAQLERLKPAQLEVFEMMIVFDAAKAAAMDPLPWGWTA